MTAETFFNLFGADMASTYAGFSDEEREHILQKLSELENKDTKRRVIEYAIRWFQIVTKTNGDAKVKGDAQYGHMEDEAKYDLCKQYAECPAAKEFIRVVGKQESGFKDDAVSMAAKRSAISFLHLQGNVQSDYTDMLTNLFSSELPSFLLKDEEDAEEYVKNLLTYGYETDIPGEENVQPEIPEVAEKEPVKEQDDHTEAETGAEEAEAAEQDNADNTGTENNASSEGNADETSEHDDENGSEDNDADKDTGEAEAYANSDSDWLNDDEKKEEQDTHNDPVEMKQEQKKEEAPAETKESNEAESKKHDYSDHDRNDSRETGGNRISVVELKQPAPDYDKADKKETEEEEENMEYPNKEENAPVSSYGEGNNFSNTQALASSEVIKAANTSMDAAFKQMGTVFHNIEVNYDKLYQESVAQKEEIEKLKVFIEYHHLSVLYNNFHYTKKKS